MIEFFRASHLRDAPAGSLSYGQQKLLDAAMAFMAGPSLVLLDEPAGGVNPLPVEAANLVATQFVADVITRPEISPLLVEARRTGCATMPGSGMFNAQAQILVDRMLA